MTADDTYERQCRRTKPPISLAKPIDDPVVFVAGTRSELQMKKRAEGPLMYYL
jgi:hypothetical protein